jgi:hypothetical protein
MTAVQILCSDCHYENEAERIYCHHCGARLDRTAKIAPKEARTDTQKRVRKMFDPNRARLRALFITIGKFAAASAGAAMLVTMLLPPELPEPTKNFVLASEVRLNMEAALEKHQPPQLNLSEEQVNGYFASALKTKKSALDKPFLEFKRAVAIFKPDLCTFTVERSVFGLSIFTGYGFAAESHNGKLVAQPKSGYIGRMPINPRVMQYLTIVFADVSGVLDHDAKLAAKFGGAEFGEQHVVLSVAAN